MKRPMAEARAAVLEAPPHARPSVLSELYTEMAPHWWIKLVGDFWSRCEGDRLMLAALMRSVPDWGPLMGRLERATWAHLPNTFIAWRGCYQDMNEGGLSYSTQLVQARVYPFIGRYREDEELPILITAKIRKAACAVKVDMGVMEVLAAQPEVLDISPLRFKAPSLAFEPFDPAPNMGSVCPNCGRGPTPD